MAGIEANVVQEVVDKAMKDNEGGVGIQRNPKIFSIGNNCTYKNQNRMKICLGI